MLDLLHLVGLAARSRLGQPVRALRAPGSLHCQLGVTGPTTPSAATDRHVAARELKTGIGRMASSRSR
ncbi:hypothetical protein ACFY3E_20725 [Streptomyces griseorubiginosus]|uniref:hypothetical protein n=1 Tax=Streptomyces griseorubiginosus TaxID=67304 RepID=UPI0036C14B9C